MALFLYKKRHSLCGECLLFNHFVKAVTNFLSTNLALYGLCILLHPYYFLASPIKKTASVPGPECAPITGSK